MSTAKKLKTAGVLGSILLGTSLASAQSISPSSQDLVSALNGVFGKHAGARASHAKGLCIGGSFSPSSEAKSISSAAFFKEKNVPLLGRFSVGGGSPSASDKAKTVRGLALRFGTAANPALDLVLLSTPVFMVATPEEFLGFMAARRPDPATGKPDPAKVKAFNDATPSTQSQIAHLTQTDVPASYAQTPYWGVNAFRFTNAAGKTVYGRWRAEPVAGRQGLTADELVKMPDHFLAAELTDRMAKAAVSFDLMLQIANADDDTRNPTKVWPAERTQINLGRISINTLGVDCNNQMFNPALLPTGISLSEDPTLLVRAGAYAVSLGARLTK